jgi:hypothetical protein
VWPTGEPTAPQAPPSDAAAGYELLTPNLRICPGDQYHS